MLPVPALPASVLTSLPAEPRLTVAPVPASSRNPLVAVLAIIAPPVCVTVLPAPTALSVTLPAVAVTVALLIFIPVLPRLRNRTSPDVPVITAGFSDALTPRLAAPPAPPVPTRLIAPALAKIVPSTKRTPWLPLPPPPPVPVILTLAAPVALMAVAVMLLM